MNNRIARRSSLMLAAFAALTLAAGTAMAQTHGGGGHVGGPAGGHFGGPAGGHYYGHPGGYGYGGYGGWRGGYYGGYGWHGGYYGGWRPGYYGGWGWGWGGLGLGLYLAALPPYYSTFWWGGIPYYYANNTYYVYDGNIGQYETVVPPPGLQNNVTGRPQVGTDPIAYPANGQTEDQQAKDKYECHHWAATQSGFDPTQGASGSGTPAKRTDYMRAQVACLEGRGYTVK